MVETQRAPQRATQLGAKLLTAALVVVFVFQILLLYGGAESRLLTADDATELIHAQLIASQGGWVFADDWICTTEVRVLHMQLFTSILFRFMDDWQTIWALNAVLCGIMVFASAYALLKTLGLSTNFSLFGAMMFLAPGTTLYQWSCVAPYYSFFLSGTFWILSLYLSLEYKKSTRHRAVKYALLLALGVVSGLCGIRYATILYAPLILLNGWRMFKERGNTRLRDINPKDIWEENKTLVFLVAAYLIGLVLFVVWIRRVYDPYGRTSTFDGLVANWGVVGTNLSFLLERLFSDMFAVKFKGQSIFSRATITTLIQLAAGGMALIAAYWPRKRALAPVRYDFKGFACAQLIVTVVMLSVTAGARDRMFERYFVLGAITLYPMIAISINRLPKGTVKRIAALSLACACTVIMDYNRVRDAGLFPARPQYPKYVEFLSQSGYTFGKATYWNANNTTYMTNGKIEMLGIDIPSMKSAKWGTRVSYLERKEDFVLLTRAEIKDIESQGTETDAWKIVYEDDKFVIIAAD